MKRLFTSLTVCLFVMAAKAQCATDSRMVSITGNSDEVAVNKTMTSNAVRKRNAGMRRVKAAIGSLELQEELEEGYYYIKNVHSGLFATNGGSWGTHIAVDSRGLDLWLEPSEKEGYWTIYSGFTYSGAFGTEGFVDNTVGTDMEITRQSDGSYTIKADNGLLLTTNDINNMADFEGTSASDARARWLFISWEELDNERMASLYDATAQNPADATFLIQCPNMNNARDQRMAQWQKELGSAYCNYGITIIDTEPIMEVFRSSGIMCSNEFSVSQPVFLIPGWYKLEAQGFYRDGGYSDAATRRTAGEEQIDAFLFAGDNSVPLKSIFDDATSSSSKGFSTKTAHGYVPNTMVEAGYAFQTGAYNNELYFFMPEDSEDILIGIHGNESFHYDNWTAFDNFQLTYYGNPVLEEGYYYIKNASSGQFVTNGGNWGTHIAVDNRGLDVYLEKSATEGCWRILSGFTTSGAFGTEGYVDNSVGTDMVITRLPNGYYTIKADNDFLLTINDNDNLADFEGESAADSRAQWMFVAKDDLMAERMASLQKATALNPVDATFLIQCPNMNNARDQRMAAWQGNCGMAYCNYGITDIDTEPIMEIFRDGNIYCSNEFSVSQFVSLLPGSYKLEAQGFYRDGGYSNAARSRTAGEEQIDAYLFAGESMVPLKSIFDDASQSKVKGFSVKTVHGYIPNTMTEAGYAFQKGLYNNALNFVVQKDAGETEIGIRGDESFHYNNWTAFDNFQLTYYGKADYVPNATAYLNVEPFYIWKDSEADMIVGLVNPDDEITLVQFDLRLPSCLSLKVGYGDFVYDLYGSRTSSRKHSISASVTDGIVRFLLESSDNSAFGGTEGGIMKMALVADNNFDEGVIVKLENILLVTPDGKEIRPDDMDYVIVRKKGDVNFDGIVDVADIASIISDMAGERATSKVKADVNGDGIADVADIATVISIMAGE